MPPSSMRPMPSLPLCFPFGKNPACSPVGAGPAILGETHSSNSLPPPLSLLVLGLCASSSRNYNRERDGRNQNK
jgi:hypothetical protein